MWQGRERALPQGLQGWALLAWALICLMQWWAGLGRAQLQVHWAERELDQLQAVLASSCLKQWLAAQAQALQGQGGRQVSAQQEQG